MGTQKNIVEETDIEKIVDMVECNEFRPVSSSEITISEIDEVYVSEKKLKKKKTVDKLMCDIWTYMNEENLFHESFLEVTNHLKDLSSLEDLKEDIIFSENEENSHLFGVKIFKDDITAQKYTEIMRKFIYNSKDIFSSMKEENKEMVNKIITKNMRFAQIIVFLVASMKLLFEQLRRVFNYFKMKRLEVDLNHY